jgi:hypothetical protein
MSLTERLLGLEAAIPPMSEAKAKTAAPLLSRSLLLPAQVLCLFIVHFAAFTAHIML